MLPVPTIAVLSSSPALASVLGATLRRGHRWRVREFRDSRALRDYMRIAPLALLVIDYQLERTDAAQVALAIRSDSELVSRRVQVIAMTRTVDPDMRRRCVQAGIDEVIVKPMSPLYLEERIAARLESGTSSYISALPHYVGPERRGRVAMDDGRAIPIERRGENIVSFLAHKALLEREDRPL
ncbi:response regulator [Pelagibacterium sp. H642]|uniref:response regulator n=1 Tax=Pelagibacterium sp. H642 TaxID=1881069 RepID=UPI002814E2E1|nr:response regulator [Pelagibacterium sp. H642]WMT91258.1 response regulator [Pelagibacterium sp. H642]